MDFFLNKYKEACKTNFGILGFKTYGNYHYRVVNDIYQSFCLHRSVYGNNATVEFAVRPVATEYLIKRNTCGPVHIKVFEGDYSWFYYNRLSETSIEQCINNMIIYMDKYLIPYFNNTQTCKEAYVYIDKMDKILGSKKLNSYDRMIMSLVNEDYSASKRLINECIQMNRDAYLHNLAFYPENHKEYATNFQMGIRTYQLLLEWITAEKYDLIQSWIQDNTEKNLSSLRWSKRK